MSLPLCPCLYVCLSTFLFHFMSFFQNQGQRMYARNLSFINPPSLCFLVITVLSSLPDIHLYLIWTDELPFLKTIGIAERSIGNILIIGCWNSFFLNKMQNTKVLTEKIDRFNHNTQNLYKVKEKIKICNTVHGS